MGSATVHSLERAGEILTVDTQVRGLDAAEGIFEVADALGESAQLRGLIADPSTDEQLRVGLITRLFTGKVADVVVAFVEKTAALRWSSDDEFVSSIEALGETAVALTAQQEGNLERLEDELFQVAQVFEGSRELQLSLSHPGEHPQAERQLVDRLFGQQTLPETTLLVTRAVSSVRGSKVARRLHEIAERVSAVAGRQIADVTSARPLSEPQRAALAQALQNEAGGPVHVNVSVDPALVGGVVVRLGDTLIDSSVRTKLTQLRQAIA